MASPVDFKGTNITMNPPRGQEDSVRAVQAFTNGVCCVTAWLPTKSEREDIAAGKPIYLSVFGMVSRDGIAGMPPVMIATEALMRDHLVYCGGETFPEQGQTDAEIIMELLRSFAEPGLVFTGETKLVDIGADSLDIYQFITDVEDRFEDISIGDDVWTLDSTIQEVVDTILAKLAK